MLADEQRIRLMISKVLELIEHDRIKNDWTVEFMLSIANQFETKGTLSEKQIAKLEEIFERN